MNSLRAVDAAPLTEGCVPGEPVGDDEADSALPPGLRTAYRALILEKLNARLHETHPDLHFVYETGEIGGSWASDTSR